MRVGLTGGIAAGKSVVAARLAQLGAAVVDHDALARAVVEVGSDGLSAVVEEFGPTVLTPDGALDRPVLARLVFADDDARARLEALLHPRIRAAAQAAEATAIEAGAAVVVHDIPLLVETGQRDSFDVLVVVDTPVGVRIERLMRSRGLSEADASARVLAQADDARRLAAADVVLDGGGAVEDLERQVDALWSSWRPPVLPTGPDPVEHGSDR